MSFSHTINTFTRSNPDQESEAILGTGLQHWTEKKEQKKWAWLEICKVCGVHVMSLERKKYQILVTRWLLLASCVFIIN